MTKEEIQKNSEHWYNKYKDAEKKIAELENKIADIKANCDLAIEGRDIKIKELEKENAELGKENRLLGERCNQLLKDKGELTDKIEKMKCCENCKFKDCNKSSQYQTCWYCTNKDKWKLGR